MYEDEETEDCERAEPCDDDYFIQPTGSLGCRVAVAQGGKYLRDFAEYTEAESFIRERMEREQFWPEVWQVSDHGNVSRYTMDREG